VTFDPTMLANGDYTIEIRATDTDDNLTSVKDQHVSVSGHLKLGREQLSATDLTIPVAGIPITITRSYDSLQANKSMDFGYGWQLGFGDAQLKVDLVPGADVGWGGLTAFLDGTRVYVTMPGGEREGFTFMPYQQAYDTFGLIVYWHPYFVPDPGVLDTLTAPDALLDKDPATGDYYSITDSGIDTYNPADPNYGGTYTVTDLSGLGSTIDATSGKLLSMKARNNNTLTFSQNAITSNTGKTVTITRDPAGHITAITDPRGNSVKYGYDVNGNLVSVTDRANDPPTAYKYDASHAHYLSTVVDPLGVQQLQVTYDTTSGRVTQMKDAKLNPINFGYDTTALTETVTDPSLPSGQQSATVAFNSRGDTTQVTDPTGAQSSATYNNASSNLAAKDLPDTVTQVRRNSDNTTTSFISSLTYDTKGEVLSTTDPAGATSRITYGPNSVAVTASDALGNTVTNTYDKDSNLLSTLSPAGTLTNYTYDKNNNLTSVSQPSTVFGQPPATSKFSYDQYGYLATRTSPTGVTNALSYDANGNKTGTTFQWTNPNNPADVRTVTTSAVYDPEDRQTSSTDQFGHVSQTHYDAKGRDYQTVDVLNNPTNTIFDARDLAIQTTNPDGKITDTVYDTEGQAIYTDDPHTSGQADVHGTHTIYDSMGRITSTERRDNVVITVSTTNGVSSSTLTSAGMLLSTTSSVYNDLGQVTQSTDEANQITKYQYDSAGRQTSVTDPLNEVTSSTYNVAGQQIFSTDALNHVTQSVYDKDGREVKTIFADGTFTTSAYDSRGRQTSVTDQMGRTTQYQYDSFGRMTAVILPAVLNPETNQTVNPTTVYGTIPTAT
jgi:YD repeat-containing protein